jgi:predicted negative regulator of RcsB-dependent stress response
MKKLVFYSGWIFAIVLVAIMFFGWNYTNTQLNAQSDNFSTNYAVLNATYDKLRTDYNDLSVQSANSSAYYKSYITALNQSYALHEKQWTDTLNNAMSAKDAQFSSTLNTTLLQRDAFWNTTLRRVMPNGRLRLMSLWLNKMPHGEIGPLTRVFN